MIDKFKEQVIFELEKDKPLDSFRAFRNKCIKKYEYSPSTELIIRINNYQKNKYGNILSTSNLINYIKDIGRYCPEQRRRRDNNDKNKKDLEKFIERNK